MSRSALTRSSVILTTLLMAGGLIACRTGDSGTPVASDAAAPAAGNVPVVSAAAQPVDVEVTVGEYAITSTLTTFQTGVPYRFVVTNKGLLAHQFRIMPRGDTAAMIAQIGAGQMMTGSHQHPGELVSVLEDRLTVGATVDQNAVFLTPGDFEMSCHISGHAEAGMVIPITIEGDAFAGAPAAGEHADGQVVVDTSQMADMPCHRMGNTIMGRCTGTDIERLMAEMRANGMLQMHEQMHGEGSMMGGMMDRMMGSSMPMSGTMPMCGDDAHERHDAHDGRHDADDAGRECRRPPPHADRPGHPDALVVDALSG